MAALWAWINNRATLQILDSTSETAAGYLQVLLQPHLQSIQTRGGLSDEHLYAVRNIVVSLSRSERVLVIRVWRPNGVIAFPNYADLHQETQDDQFPNAPNGQVTGVFSDLSGDGRADERAFGVRIYEIYVPLHAPDKRWAMCGPWHRVSSRRIVTASKRSRTRSAP